MRITKSFLPMIVASTAALYAVYAPSQPMPSTQLEHSLARVESYQPGTTTLSDFLKDGWRTGDIVRGKLGIIAWRSDHTTHTADFILGTCGDLKEAEVGLLLDMTSSHKSLANQNSEKFSTIDFHWPNGMTVTHPDGTTLQCIKSYHLRFTEALLESRERL